jgi:hypothetical protein
MRIVHRFGQCQAALVVISILVAPTTSTGEVGLGSGPTVINPTPAIDWATDTVVLDFMDIPASPDIQGSMPSPESVVFDQYRCYGATFESCAYPATVVIDYPGSTPHSLACLSCQGCCCFEGIMVVHFVVPGTNDPGVTDHVGLESVDSTYLRVHMCDDRGHSLGSFDVSGDSYNSVNHVPGIAAIKIQPIGGPDLWYAIDTFTFDLPTSSAVPVDATTWGQIKSMMRLTSR